jgi:hypothetical protein
VATSSPVLPEFRLSFFVRMRRWQGGMWLRFLSGHADCHEFTGGGVTAGGAACGEACCTETTDCSGERPIMSFGTIDVADTL